MTSAKLSRDFGRFPGSIDADGVYRFPELEMKTGVGNAVKILRWQIMVRLIDRAAAKAKYDTLWDPAVDQKMTTPIHPDMIKLDPSKPKQTGVGIIEPPDEMMAQVWSVNYQVGGTISIRAPTDVVKGTNLTRANHTNVLTQALITARSKYKKKRDGGYVRTDGTVRDEDVLDTHDTDVAVPYYLMSMHKWVEQPRDLKKRIVFPALASIKWDGVRCAVHRDEATGKLLYSTRKRKLYPEHTHLSSDLEEFFQAYPYVWLDGEVYVPGMNLTDINGKMTKADPPDYDVKTDEHPLQYYVFDCFTSRTRHDGLAGRTRHNGERGRVCEVSEPVAYIHRESTKIERYHFLINTLSRFITLRQRPISYIMLVPQEIMVNDAAYDAYHSAAVSDGHEGTIITNCSSVYTISTVREERTYQMRKRKPRYDDVFKIKGYKSGTGGSAIGAIIFELWTKDGKSSFDADPEGISLRQRKEMFSSMTPTKFDRDWKGKSVNVTFHSMSRDGKPMQPKVAISI